MDGATGGIGVMESLILASSSKYRKALLERLNIEFSTSNPDIDEKQLSNELPESMVRRLAVEKAEKLAIEFPSSLVIGSDQIAILDNDVLGKPGNLKNAIKQLTRCSGKKVTFLTAVALIGGHAKFHQVEISKVEVYFRTLSPAEIEKYLTFEKPFDCAGSFKVEGLGISLFQKVLSDDPTSLEGLPLILVSNLLRQAGFA